ncbi:MAG: CapA family protein [Deltaproteobacteria bacterium]
MRPLSVSAAALLATASCLAHASPRAAGSSARGAQAPTVLARASLLATGDIMMHEAVKQSAAAARRDAGGRSLDHEGFDELFAQVAPLLHGADLAFGNMEFPVAPHASHGTRAFVFNAPPIVLQAIRAAGFGLVSFANNHAYDQGPAGVTETLDELARAGLPEIGAGHDLAEAERPWITTLKGIRVAFLGCTARFNEDLNRPAPSAPHVNPANGDAIVAAVASARRQADFVVVSVHWGTEYAPAPSSEQTELAHRLIDAGAGLVLGSHPHVLEPLELYPGADGHLGLVAYSLGNFISNQSRGYVHGVSPDAQGDTRDGVLLHVELVRRQYLRGPPVTELGHVSFLPLWTENDGLAKTRSPGAAPTIRVVPIDDALAQATSALNELLAQKTADPAAVEALQRRIALLDDRRSRIVARLGDQFADMEPAQTSTPPPLAKASSPAAPNSRH